MDSIVNQELVWPALAAFVSAVVATVCAIPPTTWLARRIGLVDRPGPRGVNKRPDVPLMGGLAIGVGLVVGFVVLRVLGDVDFGGRLWALAAGAGLLMFIGGVDDRVGLSPRLRLAVQLLAAALAIYAGFSMTFITLPFTRETIVLDDYPWVAWSISAFFIVASTNGANFLDGLDGLSAGITLIVAATLTLLFAQTGAWTGVLFGVVLVAALAGFLPFNYPPGRIFLGDMGAYLIGYTVALLALEGFRQLALLPFLVPVLLILGVPALDMASSIVRRIRGRGQVMGPDRRHIHHRMLDALGSQRAAVNRLYGLTLAFCTLGFAVSTSRKPGVWIELLVLVVLVMSLRMALRFGLVSNEDAHAAGSDDDPAPDARENAASTS